jgi:phospholipid-binding lipoprotein MlaA
MQAFRRLAAALSVALLAACASVPPGDANDPFESFNRKLFAANQKLDKYFVIPTAGAYVLIVPEWGRRRVHDLLTNLDMPVIFVNDVLQGEPRRAGETAQRFLVNTTVGLGGLFDVASSEFKMPIHREDFGQTLAVWGLGEGPYMIAPFIGPDPPRDAIGQLADLIVLDPYNYVHFKQHIWWHAGRTYMKLLDIRAESYETVQGIQRTSLDYYVALREFYRQYRNNDIRNGKPQ